jgi:alanyl-tRNA synthetase
MTVGQIRQKYLDLFVQRYGHVVIPSASLVPENDSTTLFTSSGMQPMMPYLLGQVHPLGKRLVDSQKCFRSQDIDDVGDNRHTTFFEMLGNWSLGDYFKQEQLSYFFAFLIDPDLGLGLDPNKIYVSVFAGGSGVPKDQEAILIWQSLFSSVGITAIEGERIFAYEASKNWWSRSGEPDNMPVGEPGGPDSEVFYDFGPQFGLHESSIWKDEPCHINCDCGRYLEIGNSVFMQFQKQVDGSLRDLPQKNIDFGGGLVRLSAAVNHNPDVFLTDIYEPLIRFLEKETGKSYKDPQYQSMFRIIVDHLTASVFLISDGVIPSNKSQGYVLRRLLRRAMVKLYHLNNNSLQFHLIPIVEILFQIYSDSHLDPVDQDRVYSAIQEEVAKFDHTLVKGLRELQKTDQVTGKTAFNLYQNFGFPLEVTTEILAQSGKTVDLDEFKTEFDKHKELSRTASAGMFKGGLADHSQITTAYHTATHLLHASLRRVLGQHVEQKGSNINKDRLRFDFSHPTKLTDQEISQIEDLINQQISASLPVSQSEENKQDAIAAGAMAFFGQKYPDTVTVYTIGDPENFFSKELCGGPHVSNTSEIGKIKIIKQESLGSNTRRVYLKLLE